MTALQIGDTSWSLGVLIAGPIVALLILGGLGAVALGFFTPKGEPVAGGLIAGGIAWVLLVGGLAAMPWIGFYPYKAEYHQWREIGGPISQIDKRLISSGDGMQEKFVVRFEGSGQQYGCDDTRCAGIKVGDELNLSCKRAWQYTGTDGYDCRFVSTEPAS